MDKNKWYFAHLNDGEMFYTPCVVIWNGTKHIVLILYESGEIEESIFKFDEYGKDKKNGYSIEDVKDISQLFDNIFN